MGRPAKGYRTRAGKRVPGTTTIVGRFKDSGGLIHWAWNEGVEGRDYKDTRDKAANAGTLAHDMVEAHIQEIDRDYDAPHEMVEAAATAFKGYLSWEQQTRLQITHSEVILVHEDLMFGGTLDAIGTIDDQVVLLDWKTGARTYPDALYQLAAYGLLMQEGYICGPDGVAFPDLRLNLSPVGGFHICRFSRDTGDFHHSHYTELGQQERAFRLMRELYEIDKVTKRRA